MAQQDGAAKKKPAGAAAALHSRFIVGSVSEENSEDENQGKGDVQLDEKDIRSLSPSSGSSDSTYEMGFDHIDGAMPNLRLAFVYIHSPLHEQAGFKHCAFVMYRCMNVFFLYSGLLTN